MVSNSEASLSQTVYVPCPLSVRATCPQSFCLEHLNNIWWTVQTIQFLNLLKPNGHVMHQQFNLLKPTDYVMHQQFNLLNPTGHVIHQQFNIQQLYLLPTLYLCVLYLSLNKQRLVPLTT